MSAIDEFLDFEVERKEKLAKYTPEGHMDAVRGGAVGGAAINKVRGEAKRQKEREKGKTAAFDPGLMAAAAPAMGRATFGQTVKGMGQLAGAAMLVGAGVKGLEKAYEYAAGAVTRARGYKGMVEANPQLKKMDRVQVERAYNTLHRFNPEMAGDPLVAGSFVRRAAEMGTVSPQDMGQLAGARDRAKGKQPFEYGMATAAPGMVYAEQASSLTEQKNYLAERGRQRAQAEAAR